MWVHHCHTIYVLWQSLYVTNRETIANIGITRTTAVGNSITTVKSRTERWTEALWMVFPLAYKSRNEDSDKIIDPDEYPNVKFWASGSFDVNSEHPGEVGRRLRFLEDKYGRPITQRRLEDICRFLSDTFKELKELMPELLPSSWATGANCELRAKCHSELGWHFQAHLVLFPCPSSMAYPIPIPPHCRQVLKSRQHLVILVIPWWRRQEGKSPARVLWSNQTQPQQSMLHICQHYFPNMNDCLETCLSRIGSRCWGMQRRRMRMLWKHGADLTTQKEMCVEIFYLIWSC